MILLEKHTPRDIRVAVFDFDGTLSTLRCGWETVMGPMMEEALSDGTPTEEVRQTVREFIDRSTGIQTILQMKWLAEEVVRRGGPARDPWDYKAEYNRRLMETVAGRRAQALAGGRENFLIAGGEDFLRALKARGVTLLAASGTDEADVQLEAAALGLDGYFDEIAGAKPMSEGCSKEATLERLIAAGGAQGAEGVLVVGDGPVEIRLGRKYGALTLGVASDEEARRGLNPAKVKRLTDAGAHALTDSFADLPALLNWMDKGEI
jgi:phosphoglycolate phosphatase-like HAD superfamily hydrolase